MINVILLTNYIWRLCAMNRTVKMERPTIMTIAQIKKASLEHKYLGLRFNSGHLMGINSKCVEKAINRTKKHLNSKTEFQSYIPLNLNEYINYKHPFVCGLTDELIT